MIDLHVHSTFSDGTLTPTQLVEHAMENHLTAFALTDHDTVDGLGEAFPALSFLLNTMVRISISSVSILTGTILLSARNWIISAMPVLNGIVKWLKSLPTVDFRSLSRLCRKCLVMPF